MISLWRVRRYASVIRLSGAQVAEAVFDQIDLITHGLYLLIIAGILFRDSGTVILRASHLELSD